MDRRTPVDGRQRDGQNQHERRLAALHAQRPGAEESVVALTARLTVAWLSALALIPDPASAATFHVSPAGDDRAPGTAAHPWQTLERVNASDLEPGDRVLLEGGKSFAGTLRLDGADGGTPASPVVIGSFGSGRATIHAGDSDAVYAEDVGGLLIRDVIARGSGAVHHPGAGINIYTDLSGEHRLPAVRIENVETFGFGRGISVGSWAGRTGYDGIAIEGVDAWGNARAGILTYAETRAVHRDVVVRRCRAWANRGIPGAVGNTGSGIVVGGVDGGRVEHSVAHDNGGANDSPREGPVGIWTYDSHAVVIERNVSYGNRTGGLKDGGGFDLDDRVSGSTVQYNYSYDNDGPGFLLANPSGEGSHRDNVVRFNLSHGDGRRNGAAAVTTWQRVTRLLLMHNTVVAPASGTAVAVGKGAVVAFHNNVLSSAVSVEADATDTTRFDGNTYWPGDSGTAIEWGLRPYHDLEDWRRDTGQESQSPATARAAAPPVQDIHRSPLAFSARFTFDMLAAYAPRGDSTTARAGVSVGDPGLFDLAGRRLPAAPFTGALVPTPVGDVPREPEVTSPHVGSVPGRLQPGAAAKPTRGGIRDVRAIRRAGRLRITATLGRVTGHGRVELRADGRVLARFPIRIRKGRLLVHLRAPRDLRRAVLVVSANGERSTARIRVSRARHAR